MNIGIIVTPMTRGQVTIPKKYRDKLGIDSTTPLNITLEEDKIVLKPIKKMIADNESPYVIKPKYTKAEYLKILEKFAKSKLVLWTKEDDKAREEMRKKDEERWKKLNW